MLSVSQQALCDSIKAHIGQNSRELNSALVKEHAGVILGINKPSNDDTGWILARKVCCAEGRWEEGLGAMKQDLERRGVSMEGQLPGIHCRVTRRATESAGNPKWDSCMLWRHQTEQERASWSCPFQFSCEVLPLL